MWTKIKKIIPQKAKRFGLEDKIGKINLKNSWDEMVAAALGDKFKKRSSADNLKNNVLYIRCSNAVWAGELQIRKEKLLDAIKKSGLRIKQIKFIF